MHLPNLCVHEDTKSAARNSDDAITTWQKVTEASANAERPAGKSSETPMTEVESIITCPHCGHSETETMPTNACQFFYDCKGCGVLLKPEPGDCCVYCSYGTVPCPPVQEARRSGVEPNRCGGL